MSHVKIIPQSSWPRLRDHVPIEVKVSSRGFMRGDQLKVASEVGDRFIHEVRKIEDDLDTDNLKLAHVISCGSAEFYGPNANADAWDAKSLTEAIGTYVKHAKWFRDHDNKPTSDFYGTPKLAMYDDERKYGRLLVGLFANEKTAREHGDKAKVADVEIEKLARGEEIPVSHGSSIQFDVCSACGNKAPNRKHYCESKEEGGTCTLFGCKTGLSKIAEDGRQQFVYNPNNVFFDISGIGLNRKKAMQADRIAYADVFDLDNVKVAMETGRVLGGAELAECIGVQPRLDFISTDGLTTYQSRLAKVAVRIAELQRDGLLPVFEDDVSRDVSSLSELRSFSGERRNAALHKLAMRGEFIGPQLYAKLAGASADTGRLVAKLSVELAEELCTNDRIGDFLRHAPGVTPTPASSLQVGMSKASFAAGTLSPAAQMQRIKIAAICRQDHGNMPNLLSTEALKLAAEYFASQVVFFDSYWQ